MSIKFAIIYSLAKVVAKSQEVGNTSPAGTKAHKRESTYLRRDLK